MKTNQNTKTALAVFAIVVMAGAFWLLLLSPKRDKSAELSEQVTAAKATLASAKQDAEAGAAAKKKFRRDYQQLILLGKAVPAEAETASLLVQLNDAARAGASPFLEYDNEDGAGEGQGSETDTTIAQLPPLGSQVGPAGLRAMPTKLTYAGGYYSLVKLLRHLNGMVKTEGGHVVPDGRLVTVTHFQLQPGNLYTGFNLVEGSLNVTSYTTPPDQGLTAGASPAGVSAESAAQ